MRKSRPRLKRSYTQKPRRKKTLQEVLELKNNEIWVDEQTGIYLYLEENLRLWTGSELIAKFYEINKDLNPISFVQVIDYGHAWAEKDWYAIMYAGWHIRICKGSSTEGPHQTQLWFKSQTMGPHWIASLQLMGFYYNEGEMKVNLLLAIKNKEFYMSDEDRDKTLTI